MNYLAGRKLVFLPGLDGTGLSFEPLHSFLPPGLRVQVVAYPADRRLDFEQTVQWAADRIQPDPDAIVLAESFSGPVAVALVGSGRLRAKCLVLCATFARSPRPHLLRLSRRLPVAALLRLPFPHFLFKHIIAGGPAATQVLADLWRRVKPKVPPEVLVHRLEVIRRVDVRPWLSQIKVPCLYIQATGDRTVPAGALLDFAQALPDLRAVRIQGPHFILQAQPQASLAAIEDFLRRIALTRNRSLDSLAYNPLSKTGRQPWEF
jgi:pimeloyl-[acyl-carrier protein] methyl ester esterase